MSKLEKLVTNPTPLIIPLKDDDPSYKSTWSHCAWVATGCITVMFSLANAILRSINSYTWLKTSLVGFLGYLFADLVTGVYHWYADNYATSTNNTNTNAVRHHKFPWEDTKRQFANNLYVVAHFITFTVTPINLIFYDHPVVMGFVGITGGCLLFSLQFHVWAHMAKSKLPSMVVILQDSRVLLSQSQHVVHHRSHNSSYCIVSGIWNRFLDEHRVFEALEMAVFYILGLKPRSWSEPNSNSAKDQNFS